MSYDQGASTGRSWAGGWAWTGPFSHPALHCGQDG